MRAGTDPAGCLLGRLDKGAETPDQLADETEMLTLDPEAVDLSLLRQLRDGAPARLADTAMHRVAASAASVSSCKKATSRD
jgi:hypothetical protein